MKVRDIMTDKVAFTNPRASVTEAAQLMQKHDVGSIPVCDENGVIGIVTDRDIVIRNVANAMDPRQAQVQDVMTSHVWAASPDMDTDELAKMMGEYQIRRVPVVENNQLVGIVALGDIAVDRRFDVEASEALSEISIPSNPEQPEQPKQPDNIRRPDRSQ
ncbi:MAG: CBS domain-containing protein [Eubacteriales bacterium]|nr:CBS domain-containing protein [Eubacteriales bacterium]